MRPARHGDARPHGPGAAAHRQRGRDGLAAGTLPGARPALARTPLRDAGVTRREGACQANVRTIVHPTDFSDCSDVALRAARALARDHGARLILLHVVSVIEVPHLDEPAAVEDPEICRQTLEGMCKCLDDADLKYPATALLKLGQSAEEILRTADETGCDLLVMGTHGRTGLGRLLMGSVAEQVLRRARTVPSC